LAAIPNPEHAAALGDVYKKLGRNADANKQYKLVEYIGKLNSLNQALYNRELAYFYADRDIKLPEALTLAQNEMKVRQDVQGYDLLAWSLYKNGRYEEAKTAIAEALKLGTRDAKLFFHAGMIHKRLGENDKARDFLQRAVATNPQFHILHADVARKALAEVNALVRAAK
ncbi:MAG: tetratricopeptide repeat protein, partial [Deltaproteobacteria bacterium]|nr:tetratricopeptide repeat protein [Deltaproteobacteria bacterium]